MEMSKVMVKKGDVVIVTCPFCRKTKKMSVAHYKETGQRELKIKCSCDKVFCICLEYRRHHRKTTRLLGKSVNVSNCKEKQDILIKNVSLGGVGFCAFSEHKTRKDDQLQILFNLNDIPNSLIDAHVMVRSSTNDYIGCEFNLIDQLKTSLGFYLIG